VQAGSTCCSACMCLHFKRLDVDRRLGRGSVQDGTICCTARVAGDLYWTGRGREVSHL
jgi:hypothetical protein